ACRGAVAILDGPDAPEVTPARSTPVYLAACDGGAVRSCNMAGWRLVHGALHNTNEKMGPSSLFDGVPHDETRALALFPPGCDGGDMRACDNVGFMYANGYGRCVPDAAP